jgi:hypothetical protein
MPKSFVLHKGKVISNTPQNKSVLDAGAFQVMEHMSDMNTLPYQKRKVGMLVHLKSENKFYVLRDVDWIYEESDWELLSIHTSTSRDIDLFVDKEIPSGLINGVNKTFVLSNVPEYNSEHLYLNGLLKSEGLDEDYLIIDNNIVFNIPPKEGDKIRCSYKKEGDLEELNIIDREVPQGEINGFNKEFLLNLTPTLGSEHIFLNGLLQDSEQGYDYVLENNKIIFTNPPDLGDLILCNYRF